MYWLTLLRWFGALVKSRRPMLNQPEPRMWPPTWPPTHIGGTLLDLVSKPFAMEAAVSLVSLAIFSSMAASFSLTDLSTAALNLVSAKRVTSVGSQHTSAGAGGSTAEEAHRGGSREW